MRFVCKRGKTLVNVHSTVAERTRWKTVATGRGKEGVIGNVFKVKMIPFCRGCTGKELVENMVGT
jgi:hypothetical protein